MFNFNKNQDLFFGHTFLFGLFNSIVSLGWVYLYTQGVGLFTILIAHFIFRLLLNFVFTPLTHFILKHWTYKPVLFIGVLLQAAFLGSFYFAAQNLFFLGITVVLMAAADSFYWVVVDNLERLVPQPEKIADNVGLVGATSIIAEAVGAMVTAFGLYFTPGVTFIISVVGMLLSFIPISLMRLTMLPPQDDGSTMQVMLLNEPIRQFLRNPLMLIVMARGFVGELIAILPIFLVHFNVTLIEVGLLYGSMCIGSAIASILVGHYENSNKAFLSVFFGGSTILLLLVFAFLPINQLGLFMLFYGLFGVSWEVGICAIAEEFCNTRWRCVNGGILDQLLDNTGRNLLYPILLFLMVVVPSIVQVVQLMFIVTAIVVAAVLVVEPEARRKLAGLTLRS